MTKAINIDGIAKYHWFSRWSGSYTFISCSFWGYQYNRVIKKVLGKGFDHTLFMHRQGVVTFYVTKEELAVLGNFLAKKAEKNNKLAITWLKELKRNSDKLKILMKRGSVKLPSVKEFAEFYKYYERHLAYHVFMKKTVDFLPAGSLKKLLPYFKEARIYTEHVYSGTEKYFRQIAKIIGKKEKYNSDYLTCLTRQELTGYLKNQVLPAAKVLKDRYQSSVLYFANGKKYQEIILTGQEVGKLEKLMFKSVPLKTNEIAGVCAYPGKITGKCRIILDPFKVKKFNQGDILVTGMTRPEFLPLVKKASAIITDVGGLLCHAAIIARELKIPCVVGTHNATKTLKDGDLLNINKQTITYVRKK